MTVMKRIAILLSAIIAFFSCTDFNEEEIPVKFGVNVDELAFSAGSSTQSVTVSSARKWDVTSMPSWVSLKSISHSSISPYEWTATFSASPNKDYDRESSIIIKTNAEIANVRVTQSGEKGKYVAVESVSLSPTELTLTEGENASLSFVITPSNASVRDVTWKSSNTAVATVSQTGQVSAVAEGTTNITVKTEDGGKTASCSVTVKPVSVSSVSLDKESLVLKIGESSTLNATVLPENAANKKVSWSSSNTGVATVDLNGKVTGIGVGSAKITVTTDDGGKTATCTVTVNPISVTGVSLNQTSLTMTVGDTQTLTATVTPSNATDKSVTWSSSNTSVATVSSSGLVTARSAGTATITVTTNDGGKKATCSVTVQIPTVSVTGVSLNKTSMTMTVGDIETLTATVTPSNATDKSVTWSSSNTSVATVSSSGVITAKAAGIATITVNTNDGAKTATCYVYVADYCYEYVDLGLPSGLKWGKCNLGTSSSQGYGYTYAWGELEMKTYNDYHWQDYKWCNGSSSSLTKYNNNDGKRELEEADDVAHVILGGKWRLPTDADWTELRTQCTWVWTHLNGVGGRMITGKNGNSIFLPAAGSWGNHPRYYAGTYGNYWSSSLNIDYPNEAWYVTFDSEGVYRDYYSRCVGFSIRPVYGEISVTGVSLNITTLSLNEGESCTLTATVTPSSATNKSVTWSSSNTSVATVSSSGVVTAKAAGTATITVTTNDGGKTATCSVTVQTPTVSVTGVSLNKTSLSMTVGDTQTLTATVTPSNATDKSVAWSSSNTSVATVSSSGLVSAKSSGTATITVTTNDGGKKAACSVTVISTSGTAQGHEWIDLGLSVKWSPYNYGATSATDNGGYYFWGDPTGTASVNYYSAPLTYHISGTSYDIVRQKWGGSWRLPTFSEVKELYTKCSWSWTTLNGKTVLKATGPNGNSIYFVPTGLMYNESYQSSDCVIVLSGDSFNATSFASYVTIYPYFYKLSPDGNGTEAGHSGDNCRFPIRPVL